MMKFLALLLLPCSLTAHSLAFEQPFEIDATWVSGTSELPGLTIERQRAMREFLVRSTPYGKSLSLYFIPKDSASLSFINPDLIKKLYAWNDSGSEANCYWTSMFGLGEVSLPERFMDIDEYLTRVAGPSFAGVDGDSPIFPGDVIRLKRARGNMELHSVIYLGRQRGSESQAIVLTKNGPGDGPYLIMNLYDLQMRVYPSAFIAGIYRKIQTR